MKCSLCSSQFKGFGNNSEPILPGKCCDKCNHEIVIPVRMFLAGMAKHHILVVGSDLTLKFLRVNTDEIELETLQELVDGYIEIYPKEDENFVFFVDEEGLLKELNANFLAKTMFDMEVVGNLVVCPKELLK